MSDSTKLVSLIIPTHDAASTIGLALSSALWQTHKRLEIIIVDDGSTDETVSVIGAIADARVRLISQEAAGPAEARNRGMAVARGDYITFLDDDDLLLPRHVELGIAKFSGSHQVVSSNARNMFAGGISRRSISPRIPRAPQQRKKLLQRNRFSIMSFLPPGLVDSIGGFDVTLDRSEDWDLWLRAAVAGWHFVHQARPTALINRTKASRSSNVASVAASETRIREKALASGSLLPHEEALVQRLLSRRPASVLAHEGACLLETGEWSAAASRYRLATRQGGVTGVALRATALTVVPPVAGRLLKRREQRRILDGSRMPWHLDEQGH